GKVLTSDSDGNATWEDAGGSTLKGTSKTANYTLVAGDNSYMISCTNSFTLSFTAAATLGDGWFCYVKNAGTGEITLDPDGAEEIDSLTTYKMYPGEVRMISCDGTKFTSVVLNSFFTTFATTGTFTKPPGYKDFSIDLIGGGGSGSGATQFQGTAGGGSSRKQQNITVDAVGTTETITIAAGGTGGVPGAVGTAGGTTTFGSLFSVYGGGKGCIATGGASGGAGGGANSVGGDGSVGAVSTGGSPVPNLTTTLGTGGDNIGSGGA
ncbi:unnamed protein product, partial [marine sediment metagenome]